MAVCVIKSTTGRLVAQPLRLITHALGQANIKMVKAAELVAASRPGPTENVCPKKLGSKLDVSELNLETNVLKTVRKIG